MLGAGLWALVGLLLILAYAPGGWQAAAGAAMLTQAFALLILFPRLEKIRAEVLPDFLTIFLLFQVVNKTFTLVSLAAGDLYRNEIWCNGTYIESVYKFEAELVFLAATMLFALGWWVIEHRTPDSSAGKLGEARPGLYSFYVFCLGAYLVLRLLPGAASLGQLPNFLRYGALGAVTALLGAAPGHSLGSRGSAVPVLMLLPLFYLAAVSGMKSEMIVIFMPIIVSTVKYPSRLAYASVFAFGMLLIGVVAPLSQALRTDQWVTTRGAESMGLVQGLELVGELYEDGDDGVLETVLQNTLSLCHRASSADSGGLVMQINALDGRIGLEPVAGFFGIFVPRLLWIDKPSYQPGAWFTWYLGMAYSPETATSATATMLGTEIYWMFGTWGLAILMPALGAVYALAWQGMRRLSVGGFMGFAGMLALLVTAPRFEESHTVYAASTPIILLVYAMVLVSVEAVLRYLPIRGRR